jgi:hypothetical protein
VAPLPLPARAPTSPPFTAAWKARWISRIARLALMAICEVAATPSLAVAAPGGRAPSVEEQARFTEGLRLLQAGDARGAERAFKAGYALAHDPAFLVQIGEAEERAGAPRDAADSYAQYLRQSPQASDRQDIEGRIQRLTAGGAPAMAPGSVATEAPGPLPSGAPAVSGPAAPVTGGASAVDEPVSGGGSSPVPAAPGTVAAPSPSTGAPRPAPAPRPPARAQATDDEQLRAIVDENAPPRSHLNTAAWISAGVTVLLLGTAGFYGAKAGEKNGDVNRLLGNFNEKTGMPVEYASVAAQFEADVRDGRHDDRMAKGFAIAAGAAAAATVVLFIVDAVRAADTPAEAPGPLRDAPSARRLAPTSLATGGWGLGWSF